MQRTIVVIAHNVRSCHNVGSLLRTAEGLGINTVWLTGYTPYPKHNNDTRLPHIAIKTHKQISKTALGAEESQTWQHSDDISSVIASLKSEGFTVAAVEQTKSAKPLPTFGAPDKIAVIIGREVEGIESEVLEACDTHLEIPMSGSKESFNVSQAAAMALYHLRFF